MNPLFFGFQDELEKIAGKETVIFGGLRQKLRQGYAAAEKATQPMAKRVATQQMPTISEHGKRITRHAPRTKYVNIN